jgi:hypothetical protein
MNSSSWWSIFNLKTVAMNFSETLKTAYKSTRLQDTVDFDGNLFYESTNWFELAQSWGIYVITVIFWQFIL